MVTGVLEVIFLVELRCNLRSSYWKFYELRVVNFEPRDLALSLFSQLEAHNSQLFNKYIMPQSITTSDLRYPIGKFEPREFSEELKEQWLSDR